MTDTYTRTKQKNKKEIVDHPSHYGGRENIYEVIKVLEAQLLQEQFVGWLRGTIMAYLPRAGRKDPAAQDYAKVAWYSRYLIEYCNRTNYGQVIADPDDVAHVFFMLREALDELESSCAFGAENQALLSCRQHVDMLHDMLRAEGGQRVT